MPQLPPDEKIAQYEALVATLDGVTRKGKSMPYTSLNGHMFTFLSNKGEIAIRLSKEDLAEFQATYEAGPSIQHGAVMREYTDVPDRLHSKVEEMAPWMKKSFDYIGTLKPKPTKKK